MKFEKAVHRQIKVVALLSAHIVQSNETTGESLLKAYTVEG